ncbi:DUF6786 family protein [Cellulophaga sp. L1A9]|uniref:DUF6786 family protein n=1 Tax=Cellulophaga sp. L1A9 TaxID=2686362 RepID=UPI0018EEE690|nr:DUF6786 family protein [Cellulophaga sp. L1A9]
MKQKLVFRTQRVGFIVLSILLAVSCKSKPETEKDNLSTELQENNKNENIITYADDVSFMKDYIDIIELSNNNKAKVAVSAKLQGRVMTSSSSGLNGRSYGWINKELFKTKEIQEHINVFGGEERFWLGPEGGQYSIFFKKGSEFTLEDWYTPKLIDLEHFDIKTKTSSSVTFTKTASLVNYSGFKFDFDIEREVKVLSKQEVNEDLGIELPNEINTVAYKTTNSLTNSGKEDWEKEKGLLSIWLLGMFNPSPEMTIVIPYKKGNEAEFGVIVNDDYFGKVPAERLIVKENAIYFKGDGNFRSKIGLSPKRAKNVLGSYDGVSKTLTIVKYNKPKGITDYVNSKWEIQEKPYAGDVVNSYNDGVPEPGKKPLGPFYELETSSPALYLKAGEQQTHIQTTYHFEGNPVDLTKVSEKVLGVSIVEIMNVFMVK